jgi:membrane protease YdiL (CAAX protease family)
MREKTQGMSDAEARRGDPGDGAYAHIALACSMTWLLAAPVARAWMRHEAPPPWAVACAGLSAFGPTLAAIAVAAPRGRLREVFGRWRTSPAWVVLAIVTPLALHLVATALFTALGGHPDSWFHPPATPEQLAALVVFPIGEEFGWRGFAHPRFVRLHGPVKGSLLLGVFWGLWHLAYAITPQAGGFDAVEFGMTLAELPFYTLVIAWVFERANRSMAVAIAFHAGGHLDHIEHTSRADLRLHALHLAVVGCVALLAARSFMRSGALERAARA